VPQYIRRLIDKSLTERLGAAGAVVIDGPKAVGKTETGRRAAQSEVFLDTDLAQRQLALADPRLVLEGPTPRLLDEWQTVPPLWNAVRHAVDDRQAMGQFILTGSASPSDDVTRHSGAGRFSRLRMRPLTLVETGNATGEVSLGDLLAGSVNATPGTTVELSDLVERIITGGWPASQSASRRDASRYANDYLSQTARLEIAGLENLRHDPRKVGALLRSLARNTATEVSVSTLARDAGGDEGALHRDTVARYLDALERVHVVEIQEAWSVPLRTRTPLREAPKRHLTDTSLITAALRIGAPDILLQDPETLGLVFESLVIQQLRTFADLHDATVFHFRAKSGLEIDAIVEQAGGPWAAFEVKLGAGLINTGAASLKKFALEIDTTRRDPPSLLGVIVPSGPTYLRPDGVAVIGLTSLGV
jgi:uncharacterized protein